MMLEVDLATGEMHRDFLVFPKWMASAYITPLIGDDSDVRLGLPHQSATLVCDGLCEYDVNPDP